MDKKEKQVVDLEKQMSQPDFWNNREVAKNISEKLSWLQDDIKMANKISASGEELSTFYELLQMEEDQDLLKEAEVKLEKIKSFLGKLELRLLLDSEEDKSDAILEIHPGA